MSNKKVGNLELTDEPDYLRRMTSKELIDYLKPIRIPRIYTPNNIVAGSTYYTSETEEILLNKYSEVCGGELNKFPPFVIRDTQRHDTYEFTTVRMQDIVGNIIEITPTEFVIEPVGPRSKDLIDLALKNGYKAAYEFLAPDIHTNITYGKNKTIEVREITPRAKIVCVNMIKRK